MLTDDATNPRQIPTKDNMVRCIALYRKGFANTTSISRFKRCSGSLMAHNQMTLCSSTVSTRATWLL